jgi:hypothetical protein
MIWFAIAGNTTAIQRAWSTWRELEKREGEPAPKAGDEPPPTDTVEDTEAALEAGKLDLSVATVQLRSARLAIERDMRNLKEKEIRLMKLERRIEKRQMEARRK